MTRERADIPQSGFPPNRMTFLPELPPTSVYAETGGIDLSIPSLGIDAPVVGIPLTATGWDMTCLGNQVGWLNGNSVHTGHVYNADSTPGILIYILKLRWGDEVIDRVDGQSYVYEVRQAIDQVAPSDVATRMEH